MLRHVDREQFFIFAEPVDRPQRGDLKINAFAAQFLLTAFRLAGRHTPALLLEELHQVRKSHRSPVTDCLSLRPFNESAQQRCVGLLGVLGLATFVAEILKKILNQILHTRSFIEKAPRRVESRVRLATSNNQHPTSETQDSEPRHHPPDIRHPTRARGSTIPDARREMDLRLAPGAKL